MALSQYRELIAWQKSMDLVEETYRVTSCFPGEEIYGLTNQMRRAAVSIPSNIAEGQGRGTAKEFGQYLKIANGSRQEIETQLIIASRLGYIDAMELREMLLRAEEVGRILAGLRRSLRKRVT